MPHQAASPHHRANSDGEVKALARGGALNFVGAVASGLFNFALILVVTRGLGQADAGAFFAATAGFMILLALVDLGASTGVVRWIPAYLVTGRPAAVRECLRVALPPVLATSIVLGAALLWAAPHAGLVLGAAGEHVTVALRVLAVFLPVAAAYEVVLAATRGFTTMHPTVVVDKLARVGAQPLAILLVLLAGGGLGAVAVGWALPYLPGLLAGTWLLARLLRRSAQRTEPVSPPPETTVTPSRAHVARDLWRFSLPRGGARLCQVAGQRLDIILVASLLSAREAAVYTAATRLLVFGQMGAQAVLAVLAPALSRLMTLGDAPAVSRVFRLSTAWVMALTWPVYLAGISLAPVLLTVFGEAYTAGAVAVAILGVSLLYGTATGPVDIGLLMSGRSGLSLFNMASGLAATVALDLVLIPRLGIEGAALGWAAGILLNNTLALVQVRRAFSLNPASRASAWVAASALLSFGAVPLAIRTAVDLTLLSALGVLLACGVGYLGLLLTARRLLELDAFTSLVRNRRQRGAQPVPSSPDPATVG